MFSRSSVKTYLITDGNSSPQTFSSDRLRILNLIDRAVSYDISTVQLREKSLTARQLLELTRDAAEITRNTPTKLLINDRADVALSARADGVHLTSHSIPTEIIRQNFPTNFMIGVSTHSLETALTAKSEGADFITFSPIFETISKADYGPPQGLEKLSRVVKAVDGLPVFALGGITEANYLETIEAGAVGVAGVSWLNELVMAN